MNLSTSAENGTTSNPPFRFPVAGTYRFAGRTEPIVVLGLAPRHELRILGSDGTFRTVAEHRVRLEAAA